MGQATRSCKALSDVILDSFLFGEGAVLWKMALKAVWHVHCAGVRVCVPLVHAQGEVRQELEASGDQGSGGGF
jgi:hypothetical protein